MTTATRRTFLQTGTATAIAGLLTTEPFGAQQTAKALPQKSTSFRSGRPPRAARHAHSEAVEATIAEMTSFLPSAELAWMFANCFPNTLDTTVFPGGSESQPDTYVITGDIDAMWLRDSCAQVWPYLPFAKQDATLRRLLHGVISRQTRCILIDPYANAFTRTTSMPALPGPCTMRHT